MPLLTGVECLAAWPIRPQTQGSRPKFYRYMNEEHMPIILPDSHRSFQCRDDATMISTEDPEGFPHSGASSSRKQTAASRVPTVLGSLRASLWTQWRDHESVDSRTGIQETGAVPTIFSSV